MIRLTNDVANMLYQLIGMIMENPRGLPEPLRGLDWATVRRSIAEQRDAPEHAADLVDVISEHLVNGSVRGAITGDSLRRMQRAILLPSELAKLRQLGSVPTCASCRRVLQPREMIINRGDGTLLCANCDYPVVVPLRTCHRHRGSPVDMKEIPAKAIRAIRAVQKIVGHGECQVCVQEANAPAPQDGAMPADNVTITITQGPTLPSDDSPSVQGGTASVGSVGGGLTEVVRDPTFRLGDNPDSGVASPGPTGTLDGSNGAFIYESNTRAWDELRVRPDELRVERVPPPPGTPTTAPGRRSVTWGEITGRDNRMDSPRPASRRPGASPMFIGEDSAFAPIDPRPAPRTAGEILNRQAEEARRIIARQAMQREAQREMQLQRELERQAPLYSVDEGED